MTTTMTATARRYFRAARAAGCPRDQVEAFVAAGYVATPKALEFHALARQADLSAGPVQIAIGGARGGGKSHATFAQVVHDDCQRVPEAKWLFLRSVGKAARESFEDLIEKVCPQYRSYYRPGLSVLELPNGSRVLLGGFRTEADIEKYIGIEYDGIVIEENNLLTAERHNRLRGSLRSTKSNWRPRLYSTFNPGGIGHGWIKRTFIEPWRAGAEQDTRLVFATWRDNPLLQQAYIDYLDSLTGWLRRAWRDGDWDVAAGQYFTTWDYSAHVSEFEPQFHWDFWMGFDYGYQHPTVAHLLARDGDGHVYVVAEHAERQWLPSRHAAALKELCRRYGLHWPVRAVAGHDVFARRGNRHDDATIAEQYAECGLRLEPAQIDRVNGAAEILKRLGDPAHGIAPGVTIHPRCALLIETLPRLEHDPRRPEDVLKVDADSDGLGGDDAYDSFRYGIMEAGRAYSPPKVERYA